MASAVGNAPKVPQEEKSQVTIESLQEMTKVMQQQVLELTKTSEKLSQQMMSLKKNTDEIQGEIVRNQNGLNKTDSVQQRVENAVKAAKDKQSRFEKTMIFVAGATTGMGLVAAVGAEQSVSAAAIAIPGGVLIAAPTCVKTST